MSDKVCNFSQEELREQIHSLRVEHRQLDEHIIALDVSIKVNSLEIQRLKKRKLRLKDTLKILESQLIPNLNA